MVTRWQPSRTWPHKAGRRVARMRSPTRGRSRAERSLVSLRLSCRRRRPEPEPTQGAVTSPPAEIARTLTGAMARGLSSLELELAPMPRGPADAPRLPAVSRVPNAYIS